MFKNSTYAPRPTFQHRARRLRATAVADCWDHSRDRSTKFAAIKMPDSALLCLIQVVCWTIYHTLQVLPRSTHYFRTRQRLEKLQCTAYPPARLKEHDYWPPFHLCLEDLFAVRSPCLFLWVRPKEVCVQRLVVDDAVWPLPGIGSKPVGGYGDGGGDDDQAWPTTRRSNRYFDLDCGRKCRHVSFAEMTSFRQSRQSGNERGTRPGAGNTATNAAKL